jgi:K+-sensing histidine kinase KdpD
MERIARVAGGAYDRPQAAAVVAEEVYSLLDCDQVFLLSPLAHPRAVYVEAAAPAREGRLHAGDVWDLGERAARIFDRPFDHSDAATEPYTAFKRYLSDVDLGSWVGLPLKVRGCDKPFGLLGAATCADGSPCSPDGIMNTIASSVAAALWRLEPDHQSLARRPPARHAPHDVETMRALTNMAFGISHSLANIFSAMLGNLHSLGEQAQDPDSRHLIERLEHSSYAGIDMMQSLQKFAAEPCSCEMQLHDLSELAGEVLALIRQFCTGCQQPCGVTFRAHLTEPCPCWCSAQQIHEALINVVFNAIQAAAAAQPRGGEITLTTRVEAGHSRISVRDNGTGMTKEVHRRATEPFFTTRPGAHQGLGLSVARGIAVAHGGQLTIQSRLGEGTRVDLRLPHRSCSQAETAEQVITDVLADLQARQKEERAHE